MKKIAIKLFTCLLVASCVEPFDLSPEISNENTILVVEARLTNELKQQQVRLSRAGVFGGQEPFFEKGAEVHVIDDLQNQYFFSETEPGMYISDIEFAATKNVNYKLTVSTSNGERFVSDPEHFDGPSVIDSLYAERRDEDSGTEAVKIYVDGLKNPGEQNYYRYSYTETFKIIAPRWDPFDMVVIRDTPPLEVGIALKTNEERVCYGSKISSTIIQNPTVSDNEDSFTRFIVRNINSNDYIISHRYSILVTQFLQSPNAFLYYERLNSFSTDDDLFSQIQTGFLKSNVNSEITNRSVLGYFEVCSVGSKRLFFNYFDLFPNEPIPPYAINCETLSAPRLSVPNVGSPLIDGIKSGLIKYVGPNLDTPPIEDDEHAPYLTTARACGDCTALGSNIIPVFWKD